MKTKMAQTSLDIFSSSKTKMGQQERMIYSYLANQESSMTNKEIHHLINKMRIPIDLSSITGRINSLTKKGLIEATDVRVCTISGNRAKTWSVTNRIVL